MTLLLFPSRLEARGVRAAVAAALLLGAACTASGDLVVTTLEDGDGVPAGSVTLRDAIARADPGQRIRFDPSLAGGTIVLRTVGQAHSILPGEVYAGGPPSFQGYRDRDHGASALYARKHVVIDASQLREGITLRWGGEEPARVLAVVGDLDLSNVKITGGFSSAEPTGDTAQPYTLARGGGLAVWGRARLWHVTVHGNRVLGDAEPSRDRGAYGGGIYANDLELADCVVSGNAATGYGAAGGGIYSVGGADGIMGRGHDTWLSRCTVSGNRVTAQHAYGGGIFTLSGGPTNVATMSLTNCTVARNLAEDNPALDDVGQYYTRGGGIYVGGGSLTLASSTVAENAVEGHPASFGGKPNTGGGGIAATIGNAHVVENVELSRSVVTGNTLQGQPDDWFTGSLLHVLSGGFNLVGVLDAAQLLAPVPDWEMLSRKHLPARGDRFGVSTADALDLAGAVRSPDVLSAGTDAGELALLWYPPGAAALDQVPDHYSVTRTYAGYTGFGLPTDDFLNQVIAQVRTEYGATVGVDFGTALGDLTGVTWYGPERTWVTAPQNQGWIEAWKDIEAELDGRLGPAGLGDGFWASFESGPIGNGLLLSVRTDMQDHLSETIDQLGQSRPAGAAGDIGAVEAQ